MKRIYRAIAVCCLLPTGSLMAQGGACIDECEHTAQSAYATCLQRGGTDEQCWEARMDALKKCRENAR